MKTGELRQYTDALGGNVSPVVVNDGNAPKKIAFISYYKGEYGLHTLDRREPIVTAASADFGSPGPVLADFQAPLSHTLMKEKIKKKGKFESMSTRRFSHLFTDILIYGLLIAVSTFMMLPFIWMVSTSLKPADEIFTIPPIIISSHSTLNAYK